MKILLVSDTHGNNEVLKRLVQLHPDMDLYLHLGDSESEPELLHPFVTVRGNCDYFSSTDEKFMIHTEVGYLFATHKPQIFPSNFLKENDIKIVCNGHTHKRRFEIIDNIVYINPGSISFSRDGHDLSYATLTIVNNRVEHTFNTVI